jgi:tRNA (guanine37-N1)-methyltransferase
MDGLGAPREAVLRVDVLSLFPRMLDSFVAESVLGRAIRGGIVSFSSRSIREWTDGRHGAADDRPFGGGAGMVLRAEPICRAIGELRTEECAVIYLCPDGIPLSTALAKSIGEKKHLILLCGHYEGVDERVRQHWVDMEISIGDYVLTNGVLPAAVLLDAVSRQLPGVLGREQSLSQDSFANGLLSFPQYTRPEEFAGLRVPDVLLSGHHKKIDEWRRRQQMERTQQRRWDLWEKFGHESGD